MATCKAVAFDPLKSACENDPGKAVYFLALLSETNRDIYEKSLPVTRVPIVEMSEILEAFAKVFYPGEPYPMRHLGAVSAKEILTGVYKIFARITTPAFIISRAPMIWKTYYDEGNVVMENVNAKSGTLTINNFPDLTVTLREFIAGYCVGALEIAGVKNIVIVKNESDPNQWKYDFRWD
ncbi:DUF2378 family protein [bacterium]|nr:DUF2378 family protein [bacterium]